MLASPWMMAAMIRSDPCWHKDNETEMEMEIACAAKALDKRDGSGLRFLPRNAVFDRLVDVVQTKRGADDRIDRCGQILRRGHPVASRERSYDHPLARRHPGDHLLDEVCGRLHHTPGGTRRVKPTPLRQGVGYASVASTSNNSARVKRKPGKKGSPINASRSVTTWMRDGD